VDLPAGMPEAVLQHLKSVWVVGQQLRVVEDGQPFEPPRKTGKLAVAGQKPGFAKPKFERPKFERPKFDKSKLEKPKFGKSKPGTAPSHAFPPRKPPVKAGAGKGRPKTQ